MCVFLCGHMCLDICRLNALLQQTSRPSGVANAPCLNCRFLLAIAWRTLVAALMLQLSWHSLPTSIISVIISSLSSAVTVSGFEQVSSSIDRATISVNGLRTRTTDWWTPVLVRLAVAAQCCQQLTSTAYHDACSESVNCEIRKREICPSVKCETKCECCSHFLFRSLPCLTATTDQPTDVSD